MRLLAPSAIAAAAPLSPAQKAFRQSRAGQVLNNALPLAVRRSYRLFVRHGQKRSPVARRNDELWYSVEQIEPYDSDTLKPLPIKVLQGGTMSGVKSKRR